MPLTYPQPADRPLILGHRGASAHADDNSIDAFRLAVEHGADGVELDVRFTADDVVVLSHDPVVPGYGVIAQRSYEELQSELPNVPTLDQAAAILEDRVINIEIKNNPTEPDFDPDNRMADAIVDWVRANDGYGNCVVTSFNPDTVARVHYLDSEIVTGQLLYRAAELKDAIPAAAAAGHSFIAPFRRLMRAAPAHTVELAASYGLGIAVWTVDAKRALQKLRRAGVAAVITNDPRAALELYSEPLS